MTQREQRRFWQFVQTILVAVLLNGNCIASSTWGHISDQNFDLYTTANQDRAAAMLETFERTRSLLREIGVARQATEFPVRVIVFQSPAEYERYALNRNADAYFLCRLSGDSLVIHESQVRNPNILIHEYSHYLMHQDGVKLPLWLFEGAAEFYATAADGGSEVTLGKPARGRAEMLDRSTLISLDELLSATSETLAAQDRQRLALFYSESWALVHMLKLAPHYGHGFDQFVDLQRSGISSALALARVWDRPLKTIEADLHRYVQDAEYPTLVCHKRNADQTVVMRANSSYGQLTLDESELILCRLQAQLRHYAEAEQSLLTLTRSLNRDARVEEELAYLYLERRDYKEAGWHCHQAVAEGSRDPRLYVYYARVLEYFNVEAADRAGYLERALALKPDFSEARLELAHVTGKQQFAVSAEMAGL